MTSPRLRDSKKRTSSRTRSKRFNACSSRLPKLRNSARWVFALALGLRQGDALRLHWEDVDLDAGYVRIRKNRLRPKYAHGCGDEPCGRKAGYCPKKEQTRRGGAARMRARYMHVTGTILRKVAQ